MLESKLRLVANDGGALSSYWQSRSLAGNPDSPQDDAFLKSIIAEIVGIATYYMHHYAI